MPLRSLAHRAFALAGAGGGKTGLEPTGWPETRVSACRFVHEGGARASSPASGETAKGHLKRHKLAPAEAAAARLKCLIGKSPVKRARSEECLGGEDATYGGAVTAQGDQNDGKRRR